MYFESFESLSKITLSYKIGNSMTGETLRKPSREVVNNNSFVWLVFINMRTLEWAGRNTVLGQVQAGVFGKQIGYECVQQNQNLVCIFKAKPKPTGENPRSQSNNQGHRYPNYNTHANLQKLIPHMHACMWVGTVKSTSQLTHVQSHLLTLVAGEVPQSREGTMQKLGRTQVKAAYCLLMVSKSDNQD